MCPEGKPHDEGKGGNEVFFVSEADFMGEKKDQNPQKKNDRESGTHVKSRRHYVPEGKAEKKKDRAGEIKGKNILEEKIQKNQEKDKQ